LVVQGIRDGGIKRSWSGEGLRRRVSERRKGSWGVGGVWGGGVPARTEKEDLRLKY